MSAYRLSNGGLIDRSKPIDFKFDGKPLQGFAGDTLASALLANDKLLVGRSFKYHRPRGLLTAGAAEPNALVTLGQDGRTETNTRATMVELHHGLEARSQNRWPSLDHDIGAINGMLSPFLGAGFYYKTFMWPAAFWEKLYEPIIRKAAGLGRASYVPDPDTYEKSWAHCDLLIIGAGPTGLAAALTAARSKARVILVDEGSMLGGSLLCETTEINDQPAAEFAAQAIVELSAAENVQILKRTTVVGAYDDNVFGALERVQKHVSVIDDNKPVERFWRISAKQAILATGAEERPLVFGGNDRPGMMMAGAMRTYLNRFAVAPGKQVAIFSNGPSGWQTARDLEANGVDVVAIVTPETASNKSYQGKARIIANAVIAGTSGEKRLKGLTIRHIGSGSEETLACDALGMSGGWSPIVHLACHRGDKPKWSDAHAAFLPPAPRDGLIAAGGAAGTYSLAACLQDGGTLAAEALDNLGHSVSRAEFSTQQDEKAEMPAPFWYVKAPKGKAFVDFQNDVHLKDLGLAVREGYDHVELAKRYTTNGMATDQGKLSNVNAIGILAEATGTSPDVVGTTTFRPFYTPVSFGALTGSHIGAHFHPTRVSPLFKWAEKHGARFVETGLWHRSSWFPKEGESDWRESVDREAKTVRSHAGICDVSTLGKIEIFGSDAAEFINRVYCNGFLKLPVGKARYGLMLREDGFIYDDGTTSRLGENHFFMTTTTAFAAGVLTHLECCSQVLWPDLDVRLVSVSDQWAQMAIAGPNARKILAEIVDEDISDAAFPFLAAREVGLSGGQIKGRLFRISFSGELAFELAVPAGYGEAVADAILSLGEDHGITPYGTEALNVLRIEKGHVTHAEINGTVTPGDLGFGRMVSAKKPDFIGRVMLQREGLQATDRLRLVGIRPLDPAESFVSGSHILDVDAAPTGANDLGHVTSSCFSPHLGHTIGLAMVKHGPELIGEEIVIWNGLKQQSIRGVLCEPVFVDPKGEKLHA
ncbi:sarcosine oxidase subunit alpha family protein [Roseibium polysiphoniae]|uniref:Sarcosine oxidase subunit alpha family protein n=1 Tax=Roseibium polysiphoniae TaxID=2571221 RepID=A0ABR9CE57_9HYPH|nr:sarcosine oxidase subunit alpha family protein [Roseibium polysiphoniae]MBD8877177.1 sarcosine oxidase subunit alpha family protein [Roseibium polysiphoniae]